MVGIVGYGASIPRFRIKVHEIAKVWGEEGARIEEGLGIKEKSVPDVDEDAATLAVESAKNAVVFAEIDPKEIGCVLVGSESHPYAVKPTASIVAEAIGSTPHLTAADLQFACKAGTVGLQCCMGMVMGNMIKYGMAIGTDTSQGRPGDALEYAAGAGAGAFIIGKEDLVAEIEGTYSYTTDMPDFWRRPGDDFPMHGGRFTGEPAYFKHVISAATGIMERLDCKAEDFDFAVFHQPNAKFPLKAAKMLGIPKEKVLPGLISPVIGNTYSAASLLGLEAVLDIANAGSRILVVSFGSGAGSDAFVIKTTKELERKREKAYKTVRNTQDYINEREYLEYGMYVKHRRKLKSM